MKLYTVFSTLDYRIIRSLFPLDVMQRAIRYVRTESITNVNYSLNENICTAFVRGTKKYRITVGLNQTNNIVVKCSCPAARDWTPSCKHAAALLMVIVEYFSQWKYVAITSQQYYTELLRKAFITVAPQKNTIDNPKIPVFNKPTIIFVRINENIYPYIILANGDKKTNKIARMLEKYSSPELNTFLKDVFERPDLFDYAVYTEGGFITLMLDKSESFTPIWQFKQCGSTVEVSFTCKNNTTTLNTCVPLSDQFAIDLIHGKIIQLQATNQHCYKYLAESALKLSFGIQPFQDDAKRSIGAATTIARFLAEDYQISALQNIRFSSSLVEQYFAFPDKDSQAYRTHCVILDIHNKPVELTLTPIEPRIVAEDNFDTLDLAVVIHMAEQNLHFSWPSGSGDFVNLMNITMQKEYTHILPAMIAFARSFYDQQITEESRKQEFFKQIKTKAISADFFKSMHYFWNQIFKYDTYKLKYNQDTESFSYFCFSGADLLIPIAVLLNFIVKHKATFNSSDEVTTLSTNISSKKLSSLAHYLQEFNIPLYFNQKKVVQKSLSVEIDMESAEDWFSIAPSFYEKDVLLTKTEWQNFLTTTKPFHESETEIQVFDEKTEKMLTALRAVKDSYQSPNTNSEKTCFEIPRLHIFTLLALNKSGVKLKASPEDKTILKNLQNFTHIPAYGVPEKLQCVMRDYQIKGYDWLAFLYQHKFGACLADDMGLGKTVQAIAFLAGIKEGKIDSWDPEHKRPHLIIAPASVIGNWEQEITRFYPDFITKLYLGAQRALNAEMFDIILTTYDTIRTDIDTFKNIPFHVVIFDEAQAVKNHKSQRTEAAQQLQAIFKISLTGTPLENNAQELCSIMNLTLPGLLPDKSVVMNLIKKGEYQAFHERIAPFVLRRTKQEYLHDLPEKTEHDVYLTMTKKQKGLYGAIVDEIKQEVYKAYREKTKAQAGIVALTALLRLRQICVAPALVDTKQEMLSPKIEYLLAEIAKYVKENTPLLVFSQFVGMLDIVMHFFKKNKIAYLRIDGSVPALQRKKIVEEFQQSNKVFVLLLSLKTGGVGLNLTRARVVIHLDPWWNPAVENQASDRVHRIGQQHDVKIIRLLMKDSIEEKMLVLKQKKKALFDAIMQGASGAKGSALTKQDFDFLLVNTK